MSSSSVSYLITVILTRVILISVFFIPWRGARETDRVNLVSLSINAPSSTWEVVTCFSLKEH